MATRTELLSSSAIEQVTYDDATGDMSIVFTNGSTAYDFHNVPETVFLGLLAAPSPGSYYHSYIKDQYP
jgi:hypothetical protein